MHDETHVPDIYQYIRQPSISFYFSMGISTTTATKGKKTSEIFSIVTDIKIWNLISHRRLEIAVCQVNIWARNTQNNQEWERKMYEWKQTWRKTWKNISTTRSSSKKKKNTQKWNAYDVTSSLTSNQRSVHIALAIKINWIYNFFCNFFLHDQIFTENKHFDSVYDLNGLLNCARMILPSEINFDVWFQR